MGSNLPPMPGRRDPERAAPDWPPPSPTPRRRSPHRMTATAAAVVSVKPAADVWATAQHLAGGDTRRLRTLPDGSVIVRNS